ncbi:MAG: hypothetical protein JAY90_11455 [Candidatus Thiodiazotropha lotti]|nr:hypothetical protein [Candidatus Thiodiazotropha lotti]
MIHKGILLSGVLLFLAISTPAFADEQVTKVDEGDAHPAETVSTAVEDTRIEVDQDANVIRFFIDGEEAVHIDATGLQVRDNIRYGGVTVDIGRKAGGTFADVDAKPAGTGE